MAYYDYKIKQNFPCGCRIDEMANGSLRITYCPKHKAAPDMYEALGIALDETPGFMLGEDVKQKMRQARAKAEGK